MVACVNLFQIASIYQGLEAFVESKEFVSIRKKLSKTQVQMSQLLGTSVKAVHSYEQGWRTIPAHVERQLFFLVSSRRGSKKARKPCWTIRSCPPQRKRQCPAWEFKAGEYCWFINGTICEGTVQRNWQEKMQICRSCEVFEPLM